MDTTIGIRNSKNQQQKIREYSYIEYQIQKQQKHIYSEKTRLHTKALCDPAYWGCKHERFCISLNTDK